MLPRLRLDNTRKYEQAIAANKIADMLEGFILNLPHIQAIGAEQGIKKWDDFVLLNQDQTFTHIQAKRQTTDFSTAACIRGNKRGKPGELQERESIDESMVALAGWIAKQDLKEKSTRKFVIIVPGEAISIRKDLTVRHLKAILNTHINSTTTTSGLEQLAKDESSVMNCYNWMTTWCGFKNWDDILFCFKNLSVEITSGEETEIDARTKATLSKYFSDPATVFGKVRMYVDENSSYTGQIAPRQLLNDLKSDLLPGVKLWTKYHDDSKAIYISGINDLEVNDEVERVSKIVPLLWSDTSMKNLKISSEPYNSSLPKPTEEIFQLALHLPSGSMGFCFNWDKWQECLRAKLGGTLGIDKSDFDTLSIKDDPTSHVTLDGRQLKSQSEKDLLATELTDEMIKTTWALLEPKVDLAIQGMKGADIELRDSMEKRWNDWKLFYNSKQGEKKKLMQKMLHPTAEGRDIAAQMRVGVRTLELIKDGIMMLLIVSVALNKNADAWDRTEDGMFIRVLGLRYWSGPAGLAREVQQIDNYKNVKELIGKETESIVVMPQSNRTETEIYDQLLMDDATPKTDMAQPHTARLLVTKAYALEKLIDDGKLQPIRDFFTQTLNLRKEAIDAKIKNLVK
ncbi:MAG: ABC-three component system protein [Cyclobacteriaceae bacterium]